MSAAARREPPRPFRPAAWIALPLAMGVALGGVSPVWPAAYTTSAGVLAIILMIFRGIRLMGLSLAAATLLLIGLTWAQLDRYFVPCDDVANWVDIEPTLVRARVRLAEAPIVRDASVQGTKATAARAQVLAVEDGGTWRPASGSVLLRIAGVREDLRSDQELEVIGEFSRIAAAANPGEYDWQAHFARERVFARLSVQRADVVQVLPQGSPSFLSRARLAARRALRLGLGEDENAALLQALVLGDTDDRLESAWADFRASGTAHHLSISGMHIVAVAGAVILLGRAMRLHPGVLLIIAMVSALAYAGIVRTSAPVTRSILLCVAMGMATLLRRNTDPVQCLFAAVVVMLICNPLDLLNPGFQLSVGTVAGLMLFTGNVTRWFMSLEHEHDRMARIIQPPRGLAGAADWARRKLIMVISAGAVAYAITLPLVLIHFRQVNPWTIPGSVILAPLVSMSLFAGLAKMIACLVFPWGASVLAWPAETSAGWMRSCVGWLASLPGAQLGSMPVPTWAIAAYGIVLTMPLWPGLRARRRIWIAPVGAVMLLMAWPFAVRLPASHDSLTVTVLSVGNASCTVIQLPQGGAAMVDCGGVRQRDLFGNTIAPFLRDQGITAIDDVLLTHNDADHRLALPDIERHFAPRIWQELRRHEPLAISGDAAWEILGPHAQTPLRGNDASTVVRLGFAGRSILFTGDIQQAGIDELLLSGKSLAADVLVAPHHGSSVDATSNLLRAVKPSLILCSSSAQLSLPQKRFDRLAAGSRVLRTGRSGAIRITISPDGKLSVETYQDGWWKPRDKCLASPARLCTLAATCRKLE